MLLGSKAWTPQFTLSHNVGAWTRFSHDAGHTLQILTPLSPPPCVGGVSWGPLAHWRAAYHPEAAAATKEGDSSWVNVTNTRSLILLPCTPALGPFQKPDPKILPPPYHAPPLFFSLSVILQQEKGQAFVVAHSVTQTQDLRLPVLKWKLSLGLSQRPLCSCRLEERGGNSYFSTWKGSRRGHEGRLFTSDTIDSESRCFSETSRECLPGCWHHVLIEFDCQQVSKGSKQAVFHKINVLWKCQGQTWRKGQVVKRSPGY